MALFDAAEALKTDMEDASLHLNDSNLLDDEDLHGGFQYAHNLLSASGKRDGGHDPELAFFDEDNYSAKGKKKNEIMGNTIDFGSSRECGNEIINQDSFRSEEPEMGMPKF
jgi:hypothetical protein